MIGEPPRRLLDIGCGQGELAHMARQRGHHVVAIDQNAPIFEVDEFIKADISRELPLEPTRQFDTIIFADVLEHLPQPLDVLKAASKHLAPNGKILVSIPNAVHWSMRALVASGRFDYTNQGILDRGHLRFFSLASATRTFAAAQLDVVSRIATPVPWEKLVPAVFGGLLSDQVEKMDYWAARLRPNLFAYQHIFELRHAKAPSST